MPLPQFLAIGYAQLRERIRYVILDGVDADSAAIGWP
jgi:hypothetical protein